jgi:hypothetical protein
MKKIRLFLVGVLTTVALTATACASPTGPDHTLGSENHTLGSENHTLGSENHTLGSENHTLGSEN